MQFFIAIDGKKEGPLTNFRVIEMIRDGIVSPDALGWHQGRDRWTPLLEIPALKGAIEAISDSGEEGEMKGGEVPGAPEKVGPIPPEAGSRKTEESEQAAELPNPRSAETARPVEGRRRIILAQEVRPFARFWARMFDYMIVYLIIGFIAGVPMPAGEVSFFEAMRNPEKYYEMDDIIRYSQVTFALFAIWHAVEAVLIHAFGTTPGKALMGFRIGRLDGQRISLGRSLGRSYYVWLAGFGLGIFPIQILAMSLGLFRLLSTGLSLWDMHLRLFVRHQPMSPARILLAAAAIGLLMALHFSRIV